MDLNEDRTNEVKEAIYCLDNQFQDNASYEKSQQLLLDGYRVFIWENNIPEKDANKWLCNHPNHTRKSFAMIVLKNIYKGTKGILKIKLRR